MGGCGQSISSGKLTGCVDASRTTFLITAFLFTQLFTQSAFAQEEPERLAIPQANVLDRATWKKLDASVEQGLAWLATQQQEDGSFKTIESGQPAITALCLMAFLAQGESPVNGKRQEQLSKAIEYIVKQQKPNGLISTAAPAAVPIPRTRSLVGETASYNHAISALALTEAYGQCNAEQAKTMMPAIEKAIAATVEMQNWAGKRIIDEGGWRYLDVRYENGDSDLSLTSWHLMFLRSARNAGFDLPVKSIEAGAQYVENCFLNQEDRQVHAYMPGERWKCTPAMAAAGVLALAHAGKHNSKEAKLSGDWILKHDFSNYFDDTPPYGVGHTKQYHYGAALCSQAMFQLGSKYWKQFFPVMVKAMVANQNADGSWPAERREKKYGQCYSTALSILSLSVPNQMLPIFQR